MKAIQTFWPCPRNLAAADFFTIKAGWLSPEYHWMSWALSCLQNLKFFGEVELITDELGKHLLIDTLGLPYTKVHTSLQGRLDQYPDELWALAKIYSYSLQDAPFIHIDGDVYLWGAPGPEIRSAEIISQNLEQNLFFYRDILQEVNEKFRDVPQLFTLDKTDERDIYSSNAGLSGGNNLSFIKKYCQTAFAFVDDHMEDLKKVNTPALNFLFEQYLLYALAKKEAVEITYFMKAVVTTPLFNDYVRFDNLPDSKIIHPVGGFKKFQFICDHLSNQLRMEYSEYYHRIIRLMIDKKVSLTNAFYGNSTNGALRKRAKFFQRTAAATEYQKTRKQADPADRDRLQEIYTLESRKKGLYLQMLRDRKNWAARYMQDAQTYRQLQERFAGDESSILAIDVVRNTRVEILEMDWVWHFDDKLDVRHLIMRNFNIPRNRRSLALIPVIRRLQIDEYFLDGLDEIIIGYCDHPTSIGKILLDVRAHFRPEDISANYPSYQRMIIDTVKRLLYACILNL